MPGVFKLNSTSFYNLKLKKYALDTQQWLSLLPLHAPTIPAAVFYDLHDGFLPTTFSRGWLILCLFVLFWFVSRWLSKGQAKSMISPFSTNLADRKTKGYFNPARCHAFCSRTKKIKKWSMVSLLGGSVGCSSLQISSWLFTGGGRLCFYLHQDRR